MRPDDTRNRSGAAFRGADVVSQAATAGTRRFADVIDAFTGGFKDQLKVELPMLTALQGTNDRF